MKGVLCYSSAQAAFESTRDNLLPRPWAVDDLDKLLKAWEHRRYRKAVIFVDNAGSDVILGICPRHLKFNWIASANLFVNSSLY